MSSNIQVKLQKMFDELKCIGNIVSDHCCMVLRFFLKVLSQRGDNSDIDQQGRLMMAWRYGSGHVLRTGRNKLAF